MSVLLMLMMMMMLLLLLLLSLSFLKLPVLISFRHKNELDHAYSAHVTALKLTCEIKDLSQQMQVLSETGIFDAASGLVESATKYQQKHLDLGVCHSAFLHVLLHSVLFLS